jgi:hypothetical protein
MVQLYEGKGAPDLHKREMVEELKQSGYIIYIVDKTKTM